MRPLLLTLAAALPLVTLQIAPARADDMIQVKSPRPVKETLDRLQQAVTDDGFSMLGRVPHAEAAKKAGMTLRPTEVVFFGKAENGTPLMICDQRAGLDLPFRALAWQDEKGQVWLGMADPEALKRRYGLGADCDRVIQTMGATVRKFMAAATAP